MTIEDQIRDEKLQYHINREVAKISALSSGRIEYLTGEETLPSKQQQIIEQATFTYSPLGKTFEKQTKTIEDQGKKQTEAIQDNKKQLANINEDYKNKLLLSKESEVFKNIHNERLDKIEELNKKIDYDNLKYIVKTTGEEFEFDKSEYPLEFLNDIKTGKISIEEAKNLQEYEEYLKKIRKRGKSAKHKETLANINILFNARNNAIELIEEYGSMILETKRRAKQEGKGLKILTPKQILQRFPIVLAQIKAGNNSESLLN